MFLNELEQGSQVFIDANIFVYHFSKGSKFNPSCTELLYRVEKKELSGATSAAILQETCHRLMMIEASSLIEVDTKNLPKYLKTHPEIVKKLKSHHSVPREVIRLNLNILPLDANTLEKSQKMKELYGLLSNDALTLQFMKDHSLVYLASNDSDFSRVDWVKLCQPLPS